MSDVTVDAFIKLYEKDCNEALLWMREHEADLATLFTSHEEILRLGRALYDIRANIQQPGIDNKAIAPINVLFEKAGVEIAALYQTPEQFIELATVCKGIIPSSLLNKAPEATAALFKTYDQFMALWRVDASLAYQLCQKAPLQIVSLMKSPEQLIAFKDTGHVDPKYAGLLSNGFDMGSMLVRELVDTYPEETSSLFITFDQFMNFIRAYPLDGYKWREKTPDRIINLLENYDQFIALVKEHQFMANRLLTDAPDKIMALFTTFDQLMVLIKLQKHVLTSGLIDKCADKIMALVTSYDQFLMLVKEDIYLAGKLCEKTSQDVARLLTTYEQFVALAIIDSGILALLLIRNTPDSIAALVQTGEQLDHFTKVGSFLASELLKRNPRLLEMSKTQNQPPALNMQPLPGTSHSQPAFRAHQVKERAANRLSCSFYMKCLVGLLAAGGIAMLVAGFIIAQPALILAGGIVAGAGFLGIAGFFGAKSNGGRAGRTFDFNPVVPCVSVS